MPVPPVLVVLGVLAGAIFLITRLTRPWRVYRATHIAPLEADIAKLRFEAGTLAGELKEAKSNAALFSRNFEGEARWFTQMKREGHDSPSPDASPIRAMPSKATFSRSWGNVLIWSASQGFSRRTRI